MSNSHWGGVVENHHFGTHEFLDLCEMLDFAPYICVNVASGTGTEYCVGLLWADEAADLLDPKSWTKSPEPVFVASSRSKRPGAQLASGAGAQRLPTFGWIHALAWVNPRRP